MTSEPPRPVLVKFASLYEPDMAALAESLIPFGRWSEENISEYLPVEVSLSTEITKRLRILEEYLEHGNWPFEVALETVAKFRGFVERTIPAAKDEIGRAVRLTAAAAIRDDGSRAARARDEILSIFLASKALAIARTLREYTLRGEPPLEWGSEFYEFATVYSDRLIHGLSFLTRASYEWAGWTDANLWVGNNHYKIYAPICSRPENIHDADRFSDHDVRQFIIPQLLSAGAPYSEIRELLFERWQANGRRLIERGEIFIDTQRCIADHDAKAHIVTVAADRIATYLQKIPMDERRYELFKASRCVHPLSSEIEDRVFNLIPID